MVQTIINTIMT